MSLSRIALIAALAALVLPASASGLPRGEVALSTIKLEGSGGYEVELAAGQVGRRVPIVGMTVGQEPLTTSYSVREERGAGLRATFGSLGALDVRFQRRRKTVERPEPNCRWIIETGVFRGSFDFVGEGGYVTVNAVDPPGEVFRLPDGFCGLGSFRLARPLIPGLRETVLAARMVDDDRVATFKASRMDSTGPVLFSASLLERVEGMAVERTARAVGPAKTFSHTKALRAHVSPPPPFSGSASFSASATGPTTWTGSLSVPFLGAPSTALTGEAFKAKLCPRIPLAGRCLPPLRDRSIRPRPALYGSGSHSQPLALARLSSLR